MLLRQSCNKERQQEWTDESYEENWRRGEGKEDPD
jgi:hypothetical protein